MHHPVVQQGREAIRTNPTDFIHRSHHRRLIHPITGKRISLSIDFQVYFLSFTEDSSQAAGIRNANSNHIISPFQDTCRNFIRPVGHPEIHFSYFHPIDIGQVFVIHCPQIYSGFFSCHTRRQINGFPQPNNPIFVRQFCLPDFRHCHRLPPFGFISRNIPFLNQTFVFFQGFFI